MQRILECLRFTVVFAAALMLAIPANAQSPDGWPDPPEGAVQMTVEEIEAIAVGNSWIYPSNRGGVYFNPNGDADTEWKGKSDPGQWYVENDEICIDIKSWGGEWCYRFYKLGGDVMTYSTTDAKYLKNTFEPGNSF